MPREAESRFVEFSRSEEVCLLVVDRAGRGKTNLICAIASKLREQEQPVFVIRGDATLVDDNSLERIVSAELGYGAGDYQASLNDVAHLLGERNEKCFVLLDGISETDDWRRLRRSLNNLLLRLAGLKAFRICITCRDSAWPMLEFDMPEELLYPVLRRADGNKDAYRLTLGDFSDSELDAALPLYSVKYNYHFPSAQGRASS